MSQNESPTNEPKEELLDELESIFEILDEDTIDADIPILNEMVDIDQDNILQTTTAALVGTEALAATPDDESTPASIDADTTPIEEPPTTIEEPTATIEEPTATIEEPLADVFDELDDNRQEAQTSGSSLEDTPPSEYPSVDDIELDLSEITGVKPASVLPGQQSLFSEEPKAKPAVKAETPTPRKPKPKPAKKPAVTPSRGENPFLPKHIRERLHGLHEEDMAAKMQESIAPATTSQTTNPLNPLGSTGLDHSAYERIINDVVALYLPKIEADIRKQLRHFLEQESASLPK